MPCGTYPDRSMQRLVVDALTGEHVILAPARALRPDTFRVTMPALAHRVDDCPFCPGNEAETPPEVARFGTGAPDTPGWRVRAVPNKFPIVGDGVAGAHEVVMLSPAHDADLAALDDVAVADVFLMLRDRAAFHLAQGCVTTSAFVNSGKAAGASIEHPHAQLVALDVVPPTVITLMQRFADARHDLVAADARAGATVATGDVDVWCPAASRSPFFLRIALADAQPRFDESDDDALRAIAVATRETLRALHRVLGDPAYNVVVHSAPARDDRAFHWWIDVVPRVTVTAGFELGTGTWVNIVEAETAAAALREAAV